MTVGFLCPFDCNSQPTGSPQNATNITKAGMFVNKVKHRRANHDGKKFMHVLSTLGSLKIGRKQAKIRAQRGGVCV